MRLCALTAACAFFVNAVPSASAQLPPAPQPPGGRVNFPDVSRLTPGVNGVPGSTVYLPPYYRNGAVYYNGPTYIMNRYNPYGYGYAYGGFNGFPANSGQFYAFMGGPAPTNPFLGNANPFAPTWANTPGMSPTGQPWNMPFGYNNLPQYPGFGNNPFGGPPNGILPFPQPPFQPPVIQPPAPQNNFGVQNVPGINGFANPNQ